MARQLGDAQAEAYALVWLGLGALYGYDMKPPGVAAGGSASILPLFPAGSSGRLPYSRPLSSSISARSLRRTSIA